MTNLREAAKMALNALEAHRDIGIKADKQIEALRAALAQPEREPVAYKVTSKLGEYCGFKSSSVKKGDLVYTATPQREWQGLTAKDLSEIPANCYEGAIWAEAKLWEKNK